MRAKLGILAVGLIFWLSQPSTALAWKCPGPQRTFEQRIAAADVIFVGKALGSRKRGPDLTTTQFEVVTPYKGRLKAKQRVTLRSCIGSKCGTSFFERDKLYVIAASSSGADLKNMGACSSSVTLPYDDDWAQRYLDTLRIARLPAQVTSGLAWTFRHKTSRQNKDGAAIETHWFNRKKPNLEFYVRIARYPDRTKARNAFDALLAGADHNTGLSYAWDWVALGGTRIIHVWAPCRFSKKNVHHIVSNAERVFFTAAKPDDAFHCQCGGGCTR